MPRRNRSRLKQVLLDTGPIVGLFNEQDQWHSRCIEFFGESRFCYVTTAAVITEALYLIQRDNRLQRALIAAASLVNDVANNLYEVYNLESDDFSLIAGFYEKFNDQKLDFADLSLVAAAQSLELFKVVTIDRRHFELLTSKQEGRLFEVIEPDVSNL
jgi:uncharacterized protein